MLTGPLHDRRQVALEQVAMLDERSTGRLHAGQVLLTRGVSLRDRAPGILWRPRAPPPWRGTAHTTRPTRPAYPGSPCSGLVKFHPVYVASGTATSGCRMPEVSLPSSSTWGTSIGNAAPLPALRHRARGSRCARHPCGRSVTARRGSRGTRRRSGPRDSRPRVADAGSPVAPRRRRPTSVMAVSSARHRSTSSPSDCPSPVPRPAGRRGKGSGAMLGAGQEVEADVVGQLEILRPVRGQVHQGRDTTHRPSTPPRCSYRRCGAGAPGFDRCPASRRRRRSPDPSARHRQTETTSRRTSPARSAPRRVG